MNTKGATRFHFHFEIAYLLAQSDARLAEMLSGGTPNGIRSTLVHMTNEGKRFLVVGGCNNVTVDGLCAGHAI